MPGEKREVSVKLSLEMGQGQDRVMKELEKQFTAFTNAKMRAGEAGGAIFGGLEASARKAAQTQAAQAQASAKAVEKESSDREKLAKKSADSDSKLFKERLNAITNLQMGGIAGRIGQIQAIGQSLESLAGTRIGKSLNFGGAASFLGRNAVPIGLGVAGLAGVAAIAAKAGGTAVANYHDQFMNSGQYARSIAASVLPVESFEKFTGSNARMEGIAYRGQLQGVDLAAQSRLSGATMGFNPTQAGLAERARQFAGSSAISLPYINRSTAEGEREYREQTRMLTVKRDIQKADRESAVATKERMAAESEYVKLSDRAARLVALRSGREREYRDLSKNFWEDTRENRERILTEQGNFGTAAQSAIEQQTQARQRVIDARQREAGAKGEAGQARAREFGARADIVGARAEAAGNLAFSVGSSGPIGRAQMEQAFRMLQETKNPDTLPPGYLQLAQQYDPEQTRRIVENFGSAQDSYKRSRIGREGSPESLREQEAGLRQQEAQAGYGAESQAAQGIAAAGRDFGAFVADQMRKLVAEAKAEILRTFRHGKQQSS